ncbi:lipid-A-disaccharide synthase [Breoghania sp. L-A4]|uniref:lipid-A-disaccharide synthase n=1 Tax=Breoghania sp. L-A4 TaxID=2304600 RepID=UPI000E36012C|nr:lipid-A-disaccharide synthase [Breoghania sp. L-A4]AXS40420.1 lipid-A-disaccharide synthase [Breoghania sp. L-A4]
MTEPDKAFSVFIVIGEESGDQLGAGLVQALRERHGANVSFLGTAGSRMEAAGLTSLFPLEDVAVMGMTAVLGQLPTIVRRVYQTVDAVVNADPDVLVIIDSPDFTHSVAKRVRKRAPHIPIVDYVSPSVWAWRPGRARKMARYIDHLLAILPFEPGVHETLGGPPCSYVGHPLIERLAELRPAPGERTADAPSLLVLPGSRSSEVSRLLEPFGETVARVAAVHPGLEVMIPCVPHLAERIRAQTATWAVRPRIVLGEADKFAAFRKARAALAASGTVTLELAISGVPMAVAYKLDWFYRRVKDLHRFIPIASVTSMVLPNIILEDNVVPEFLDADVNADVLAPVVLDLLDGSEARARQLAAFSTLEARMLLDGGEKPRARAARIVSEVAGR